jgi:hypothetical protein
VNTENIVGRIGRFSVRLEQDQDASNPCAEFDQAGTMVCWHSRYYLGHTGGSRRNDGEHSKQYAGMFPDPESFREWWKENGKGGLLMSLYLYDHSGITMSCSPFSCPWDSGQVGYIFVTRETILKEWCKGKRVTPKAMNLAKLCLLAEVECYDQYLTGDVYGYIIAEHETDDEDSDVVDDHIESCWGHFGHKWAKEAALDALKCHAESADKIPTLQAVGVASEEAETRSA